MPARVAIAVAALVRDGRILLVHRHPGRRWYPDCWDLVGGHIEDGESSRDAVIRECSEELGVRIFDPQPFPLAFNDPGIAMHGFVVTRWSGEPINAAPDEHDGLGWFGPDEVKGMKLADQASLPDLLSVMRAEPA